MTIRHPIHCGLASDRIRPPSHARSASSTALWADSPPVVACRAAWARSSRCPWVRGALDRVLDHPGRALDRERLEARDDRGGRDEARLELVAQLELVRIGRARSGARTGRCRRPAPPPRGGPGRRARGPAGAPARPAGRTSAVAAGAWARCSAAAGLAERGLGRSELGEHLGAQLRRRRLLERALEVADGRLGAPAPRVPRRAAARPPTRRRRRGRAGDGRRPARRPRRRRRAAAPRRGGGCRGRRAGCPARSRDWTSGCTNRSGSRASSTSTAARASAATAAASIESPDSAAARRRGTSAPRMATARASAGGVRAEPSDPDAQRADHRVGGQRARPPGELGGRRVTVLGQRDQQLVHIERVAGGDLGARLDQRRLGALAERLAREPFDRPEPQRRQSSRPGPGSGSRSGRAPRSARRPYRGAGS